MIPQDFIQQVLERSDIVAVIERYVPLKKAGANYQARCPFHNEKSPSFSVSPSKQFYHCFGCGAHGTAITFLMEHAGYGFVEALKELAGQAGLRVPDDGARQAPEEDGRRERMLERMEVAARHYRQALKTSERAIDYLKRRGLTGETAARFALGYAADDWQALAPAFAAYDDPLLVEAGLVIANEGKRYDRFRDRIMFPIRNERGRVIAFGGRVMGQGEPKYLNSPETPLFHKGRELYGLHEHRRAIQNADRVLVVEGYMDVVMLAQHGIDNAVASLGTAITAEQIARLLRLANELVFAFDGDAAGRKAAWRGLENSLPQARDGKVLSFLFLPEGEDPDSFVRGHGAAAFAELCAHAMPLSDFLFAELAERTDLGSEEGKVRLATLVRPHLDKLTQAPLLARALAQRLAGLTGLEMPSARSVAPAARPAPRRQGANGRAAVQPSLWRVLLQAVLEEPARASRLSDLPESAHADAQALTAVVALLREHPELTRPYILEFFRGKPEQAMLESANSATIHWTAADDVEADFQGALAGIRVLAGRAEVRDLARRRPSDLSDTEKAQLLASLRARKPE